MVESVRLTVYSLMLAGLAVVFAYWEASLKVPIFLLVGVHTIFVLSTFALVHPNVRAGRKFLVCFVLTFADAVFTSNMLGTPLSPWFSYLVLEFMALFVALHKLHPKEKCAELAAPMVRALIYLVDGFFMAVGVAQGLEKSLEVTQSNGALVLAAAVVIGKNTLTPIVYLLDEFFCETKPVREIKLDNVLFAGKMGALIFAALLAVRQWAPSLQTEFSWCMFASNVIYLGWGAMDTVAHQHIYQKVE